MHVEIICIFHLVAHGNVFLLILLSLSLLSGSVRVCVCGNLWISVIQRVPTVECEHCTTANNQTQLPQNTLYNSTVSYNELNKSKQTDRNISIQHTPHTTHRDQVSSNLDDSWKQQTWKVYQERKLCQVHRWCDKAILSKCKCNQLKTHLTGPTTKSRLTVANLSVKYHESENSFKERKTQKSQRRRVVIRTSKCKAHSSLTDIFRDKSVFKTWVK